MTNKLSSLKSDRDRETGGEWVDCPELGFDEETGAPIALKVRSIHYPPFKLDMQQTRLRLARQFPGDQIIPPEVEDRENGRMYARHLLLDWRHIEPALTPELAFETLTDPDHRPLREAVVAAARSVGTKRSEQVKAIEGNSEQPSTGA